MICTSVGIDNVNKEINLPGEILFNIFSFIDIHDLAQASRVCQVWSELASDNLLWKPFCIRDWSSVISDRVSKNESNQFWKQFYCNRQKERRWTFQPKLQISQNKRNEVYILNEQQDNHLACVCKKSLCDSLSNPKFVSKQGNTLVVASSNQAQIWDWANNQCVRTLELEMDLKLLKSDETILAALGINKIIKIWNIQTGEIIHEQRLYNDDYSDIKLCKDYIIIIDGSFLRIWNKEKPIQSKGMFQHFNFKYLLINELSQRLLTGSPLGEIRMWNINNLAKFSGYIISGDISYLGMMKDRIISITNNRIEIRGDNCNILETFSEEPNSSPFQFSFAHINEEIVVAGSRLGQISIWSRQTGKVLNRIHLQEDSHNASIQGLWIGESQIIAKGPSDSFITWDFKQSFSFKDQINNMTKSTLLALKTFASKAFFYS